MTATIETDAGQVTADAAEVYQNFFVPALFGQFAGPVAEAAGAAPGDRALDVACGTGALARALAARVGPTGAVTGLDRNSGMLAVARREAPGVDWIEGRAEALPFADAAFDAVASQFGLMFFEDREAALGEMWRALAPGGGLAVAVWDAAERSPGYAAMIALIDRLFGGATADLLRAPFALGDAAALAGLADRAGLAGARVERLPGVARFASIADWVATDVRGWTLAERVDAEGEARLLAAAEAELAGFVGPDGSVRFAAPALAITARRP